MNLRNFRNYLSADADAANATGLFITNFRNLKNYLFADADVADATLYLKEKREIRERVPLTRIFIRNFRNYLFADADAADATLYLKEKREIRERVPLTRIFIRNFRNYLSAEADVPDATDYIANANFSNLLESFLFVVTNGYNLYEFSSFSYINILF